MPKTIAVATIVHAAQLMGAIAPGRCVGCGSDAYIQLSGEAGMLCARCYAQRKDLGRLTARKGGDHQTPIVLRRPG